VGPQAPGSGEYASAGSTLRAMRQGSIAELEDWERNGAVWRPVEVYGEKAVVELCSCTGELMERVESSDPGFIDFVRARRDE
jgi:hypothetical protein